MKLQSNDPGWKLLKAYLYHASTISGNSFFHLSFKAFQVEGASFGSSNCWDLYIIDTVNGYFM